MLHKYPKCQPHSFHIALPTLATVHIGNITGQTTFVWVGGTDTRREVTRATTFCKVAPNVCGF
jgi:hypothetical protein